MPSIDNRITNILNRLRNSVYGTNVKDKSKEIEKLINKVNDEIIDKDVLNQIDLARKVIGKQVTDELIKSEASSVVMSKEYTSRVSRYIDVDECLDNVPYCARALKVLADSILAPDDIKKSSLQVFSEGEDEYLKNEIEEVKSLIKKLEIDDEMYYIVYDTLKYGDTFIEICNYESKEVPITQSLLNEEEQTNIDNILETEELYEDINEEIEPIILEDAENKEKYNVKLELIEVSDNSIDDEENVDIDKTKLIYHEPSKVIKLQSKRFKFNLGYLVLPETHQSPMSGQNAVTGSNSSANTNLAGSLGTVGFSPFSGVDNLYLKIMNQLKKKITNDEISINSSEAKMILTRCVRELGFIDKKEDITLKIRFVPNNRMQHFMLKSRKYYPYGESIFQKVMFQAKMLMALQSALVTKKLTDATDKRIIYIETGMSRDSRTITEQVRSEFNKRKFSIDNFGSITSIPSLVPNFQDIYIPQTKGKRFVEFDTLAKTTDVRDSTDEMKLNRDFLIANLGVPPSYLAIEDNLSNKNALAFENALFAENIVSYQFMLSPFVKDLVNKIYKMLKGKSLSKNLNITFPMPKMLQMEREAERVDYGLRVVQNYKEIGVPMEWSKKQVFDLPWDEIEKFSSKDEMESKIDPKPEDELMGGGGLAGGGVGGGPIY